MSDTKVQEDDQEQCEEVPTCLALDIRNLNEKNDSPLRRVAEKFQFPLQENDYKEITYLIKRFESLEEGNGLSLPQLGINKRAFIFQVKDIKPPPEESEEVETKPQPKRDPTVDEIEENPLAEPDLIKETLKKDPEFIWPKTLWINPSYTIPRDAVLDENYESCYSLVYDDDFIIGPVFRLNRINYRAYDSQGRIYEGQADGIVARVIQHEIDHLDGKLYIDYVPPDKVMKLPEFVEKLKNKTLPQLEKGVIPQFEN